MKRKILAFGPFGPYLALTIYALHNFFTVSIQETHNAPLGYQLGHVPINPSSFITCPKATIMWPWNQK